MIEEGGLLGGLERGERLLLAAEPVGGKPGGRRTSKGKTKNS